ncbi:MAG: D-alanyl-D-alanine carboxypeptidase [Clostridia bacterium]|nr:D-alanyl-D-alanine carboxypeptidase [Clostridia bacterium]
MKKSIIFTIILILALMPVFSVCSSAEYYNTHIENMKSEAYLLVNTDTGAIVFSHNADKQLKCASLVKIATAAVVVDNCEDLDEIVTVTELSLAPLKNIYSASSNLKAGEQISVRNLLYCAMVTNANDACNVLAEYIGGSIDNFIVMMNDFAKSLGCENTNFTNAHGLDEEGEYTSAYDMYLITQYAMKNSVLADMAATVKYTVPATNMSEERSLSTRCDMIKSGSRYYYEYAKGFKVGQTDAAQRCAAITATKNAYTYIAIVLGCPNECTDGCGYPDNTALYEARKMLKWAFSNLRMTTIAETTDMITTAPVSLSTQTDTVRLVPEKQLQALLLSSVDYSSFEYIIDVQEDISAPVSKGQVLGTVKIRYADSVIASVNLVAAEDISRSGLMYMGHIIKNIVTSPVFIIIAAVLVLAVLIYIVIVYTKNKQQQQKSRQRLREIKERNYVEDADLNEVYKD